MCALDDMYVVRETSTKHTLTPAVGRPGGAEAQISYHAIKNKLATGPSKFLTGYALRQTKKPVWESAFRNIAIQLNWNFIVPNQISEESRSLTWIKHYSRKTLLIPTNGFQYRGNKTLFFSFCNTFCGRQNV